MIYNIHIYFINYTVLLVFLIIYCSTLLGTASYTFPFAFTNTPAIIYPVAATAVTSLSNSAITLTGSTTTGVFILEGY